MTSRQNISASVKQRLLNRSKKDNRSFNELSSVLCNGAVSVPPFFVKPCTTLYPERGTHAPGLEFAGVQVDYGY